MTDPTHMSVWINQINLDVVPGRLLHILLHGFISTLELAYTDICFGTQRHMIV